MSDTESIPDPDASPGDIIGRYEIIELRGAGGMVQVFTARDLELGRTVALKLVRPNGAAAPPGTARARLLREAQALAKLQHPNVVTVHDVGTEGDHVFIAVDLVAGPTLGAWLAASPRPWRAIREVFLAAGRGLAAAHAAGIIHRDFKPDSVVVGESRVVVVDFGGEEEPEERYLAPEQRAGGAVDARADQFAFAASMWTALYGAPPFPGERLPSTNGGIPERVRSALARALAFRPEDRWPALADLLAELARDPAAARRRALVAFAVAIAAAATTVAFLAGKQIPAAADPCDGGEKLAGAIWDGATRARAQAAFAAAGGPTATASFGRVDAALRDKLAAWAAAHRETCEATRVRHVQSEALLDLRMSCLGRARAELAAFVAELGQDLDRKQVDRAVSSSAQPLDVAACRDATALQSAMPPPRDAETARLVAELSLDVDRLQADYDLGRYRPALALAETVLPRVRATGHAPLLARALLVVGKVHAVGADPEKGIELIYESARAAGEAQDDLAYARALIALLRPVGVMRGRYDEAARLMALAEGATARVGQPMLFSKLYAQEGQIYTGREDPAAALTRYGLALAADPANLTGRDRGVLLFNIALAESKLGRYREALVDTRQAGRILAAQLGPLHPNAVLSELNAATLEFEIGDYETAGETFKRLLDVFEDLHGVDSEPWIADASNVALVWLETGRLTEARPLAERALAVAERVLGARNPRTASYCIELVALIAFAEDRLEDARAGHRRSIGIIEEALGPDNPAIVDVLARQVDVELAAHRRSEARALARRAVAIARTAGDSLDEALRREADVLTADGRFANAVGVYEEALAVAEKLHSSRHPEVAEILGSAVQALVGAGEVARATAFAERAVEIASTHGPRALAASEFALARALAADGKDRPRALALARSARARLEGLGYRRLESEIGAWHAKMAARD